MTNYKQLTLHSIGIVEGWETEKPVFDPDYLGQSVNENMKYCNALIVWINSKQELKCAEGEFDKLLSNLGRDGSIFAHVNCIDITSIAEVREGLVYFKSDKNTPNRQKLFETIERVTSHVCVESDLDEIERAVLSETYDHHYELAIELIIKHLGKNRGELIEILKKELIIKGR